MGQFKVVKKKLKRLPRSNNGVRRGHSAFGRYDYQNEELKKKAAARGMTVSYFINWLLWKDWITPKKGESE
jgi:hypothetical protein